MRIIPNQINFSYHHKGVALLMTILLITVLVVVVSQLSYSVKVDSFVAQNSGNDLQLRYALISALHCAMGQLQLDDKQDAETKEKSDNLTDEWNRPIWTLEKPGKVGNAQVYYKINDENAKFNILLLVRPKAAQDKKENNKEENPEPEQKDPEQKDKDKKNKPKAQPISPSEQFDRLFAVLLKDQKIIEPTKLREAMVAWMKEKSGKPDTNAAGPFPTKIPLFSLKELSMAKGISNMLLQPFPGTSHSIHDYLTVWSDAKININTADVFVLQSLHPKMTMEAAQNIVKYREQPGPNGKPQIFTNITDLKKVQGLPDPEKLFTDMEELITVESSYFTVIATAKLDRNTRTMKVVLLRRGKKIYKLFCDFE